MCIDCCRSCQHHINTDYGDRCGYTPINSDGEIKKLIQKRTDMLRRSEYFFKRNNPAYGEEYLNKANYIAKQINEMKGKCDGING